MHDSFAGFIGKFTSTSATFGKAMHAVAEGQGYMRWRGLYSGSNEQLNAAVPPQPDDLWSRVPA